MRGQKQRWLCGSCAQEMSLYAPIDVEDVAKPPLDSPNEVNGVDAT